VAAARAHGVPEPFVLVGHSMGGRVAMRLAASYPATVAALVVEDMDVSPRKGVLEKGLKPFAEAGQGNEAAVEAALSAAFGPDAGREFASFEEAGAALAPWYDRRRIEGWRGKRIRALPPKSTGPAAAAATSEAKGAPRVWSDLNPYAMVLAVRHVLATEDGAEAWRTLAARAAGSSGSTFVDGQKSEADASPGPGPAGAAGAGAGACAGAGALVAGHPCGGVHLWVAGPKSTVCKWDGPGGIVDMAAQLPTARVVEFKQAVHAILTLHDENPPPLSETPVDHTPYYPPPLVPRNRRDPGVDAHGPHLPLPGSSMFAC